MPFSRCSSRCGRARSGKRSCRWCRARRRRADSRAPSDRSPTHSMRRSSTMRANASSPAVAVSASTCGLPSDRDRLREPGVRRAMTRLVQVMRFVDHDERRGARCLVTRRGETRETPASRARRPTRPRAARRRALRVRRASIDPLARKMRKPSGSSVRTQRLVLIVGQRAQRIDDQRLPPLPKARIAAVILKAERFAAPGAEHRQRILPGLDAFEHRRAARRAAARFRSARRGSARSSAQAPSRLASSRLCSERSRALRGSALRVALDENVDAAMLARTGSPEPPVSEAMRAR